MTHIAAFLQPGSAAMKFIKMLVATAPTLSSRARMARLPCRARAIPSEAKIAADASGIPASSAAITRSCRTLTIMLNCAANDTTAAAAASAPSAIIAFRSHSTARSRSPGTLVRRVRHGRRCAVIAVLVPLALAVAARTSRPSTPGGNPKSCQVMRVLTALSPPGKVKTSDV